MNIKLTSNTAIEEINEVLQCVQFKCTARTLTAREIIDKIGDVEKKLDINKTALRGTELHYTGAEHFPSAYNYTPYSTHFFARHNGQTWCIKSIGRGKCPNRYNNMTVTLSETAKTALVKKHSEMHV